MIEALKKQVLLSHLWIFLILNHLFQGLHEMFNPPTLNELLTGTFNGTVITEELMLIGGFMSEFLILPVLLSRILKRTYNRMFNLIFAPINLILLLLNGVRDLDDIFFLTIQALTLLVIFVIVFRWKKEQ